MNCQKIREQLDAALDQRRSALSHPNTPEATAIMAHVTSCSSCQALYEEYVLIETALETWKPRRMTVDLTDRVLESARREGLLSSNGSTESIRPVDIELQSAPGVFRQSTASSHSLSTGSPVPAGSPDRRSIWPAVVTVALVLLAVVVVFREKPGSIVKQNRPSRPLFPDPQHRQRDDSPDQFADIGHLVADARSAWQGITSRVSHQASGLSVFVPDLTDELGIPDVSDSLTAPLEDTVPNDDPDPQRSSEPSAVEKAFQFLFEDAESSESQTT